MKTNFYILLLLLLSFSFANAQETTITVVEELTIIETNVENSDSEISSEISNSEKTETTVNKNKDESNENDVKSDMCQVLLDAVAYFEQKVSTTNNVDWMKVNLVRGATLTSFTERFEDELTGYGMNIGFKIPFSYDNCNLPIT